MNVHITTNLPVYIFETYEMKYFYAISVMMKASLIINFTFLIAYEFCVKQRIKEPVLNALVAIMVLRQAKDKSFVS